MIAVRLFEKAFKELLKEHYQPSHELTLYYLPGLCAVKAIGFGDLKSGGRPRTVELG